MIHIDYRPMFKSKKVGFGLLCLECGDVCLTDLDDNGDWCNRCVHCGVIKNG